MKSELAVEPVKVRAAARQRFLLISSFRRLLFAEIALTVLPIVVLTALCASWFHDYSPLYLTADWSFATIVFIGLSITQFVQFRARQREKDPFTPLLEGTRFFTVILILAVVILTLVMIKEYETRVAAERETAASASANPAPPATTPPGGTVPPSAVPTINRTADAANGKTAPKTLFGLELGSLKDVGLFTAQIVFFLLSILLLVIVHYTRDKQEDRKAAPPIDLTRDEFYSYCNQSLGNARAELLYLAEMMRRIPYFESLAHEDNQAHTDTKAPDMLLSLDNLDEALGKLRTERKHLEKVATIVRENEPLTPGPSVVARA